MTDIIQEAHKNRYKLGEDDKEKKGILISEKWLAELQKHPFHSSKLSA